MRTITEFAEKPKEKEVITVGKRASVFIRTDIRSEKTEEGERWIATEYSTQVNALKFEITDEFAAKLIKTETDKAAAGIRETRDKLLAESDKEVLPDRTTKTSPEFKAWAEYRQQLRDISEQKGFPFDVEWPEKPKALTK